MKKILLTLFIIICVFLCACAHFEKEEQEKIFTDNRYDAFNEFNEFVSKRNLYDYTSMLPNSIETVKKLSEK